MAAKPKAHVYRIPKSHAVAKGMKSGDRMTARMRMMDPDEASEGDEGTMPMEEESAEMYAATPAAKAKAKTPAELLRQRRQAKA
jgi:hypothetical protein